MPSAGSNGYSRKRARKLGLKTAKIGRDGGGKIMKKRAVKFSIIKDGVESDVQGPGRKKDRGWA